MENSKCLKDDCLCKVIKEVNNRLEAVERKSSLFALLYFIGGALSTLIVGCTVIAKGGF